jgi:mannose-1-phosphate guanylyltransferase
MLRNAMILCAGLGERLRPLTEELPKPLVPVGDRSVLAHICARLARAGYRSALANTHWMSEKFPEITDSLDLELTLVRELEIRGVAGGVAGARELLTAPLIVWNGDILLDDPPIAELVERATATGGICLAVASAAGSGTVGLDAAARVVRVRGQSFGQEARQGDYVGLFALGARALAELPAQGDLFADYCLPLLRRGESVDTVTIGCAWREVGSISGYLLANEHWLYHHANHGERSFVHPSAQVAPGVRLIASVVGANARVDGTGTLERSVIWPGARVSAPLRDAVVTQRSRAQG